MPWAPAVSVYKQREKRKAREINLIKNQDRGGRRVKSGETRHDRTREEAARRNWTLLGNG